MYKVYNKQINRSTSSLEILPHIHTIVNTFSRARQRRVQAILQTIAVALMIYVLQKNTQYQDNPTQPVRTGRYLYNTAEVSKTCGDSSENMVLY